VTLAVKKFDVKRFDEVELFILKAISAKLHEHLVPA